MTYSARAIRPNTSSPSKDGPHLRAHFNLIMIVAPYGKQRSPAELTSRLGDIKRFEHHVLPAPRDVCVAWKA